MEKRKIGKMWLPMFFLTVLAACFLTLTAASSTGETEEETVSSPQITVENNIVTITAAAGVSIYYTYDGSDPILSGTRYEAPFPVALTQGIIRAVAVKAGVVSAESTAAFRAGENTFLAQYTPWTDGDIFYDTVAVADGFVAVGQVDDDAAIVKWDSLGNLCWEKHFGGNGKNVFYGVVAGADGYVAVGYATAESFGTGTWANVVGRGGSDAIIVRFTTQGDVVWKKRFGGSAADYFYDIAWGKDGMAAVGYSGSKSFGTGDWTNVDGKSYQDATIVGFGTDGQILWKAHWGAVVNSSGFSEFHGVAAEEDSFIAAGHYQHLWINSTGALAEAYEGLMVRVTNSGAITEEIRTSGLEDSWQDIAVLEDGFTVAGYRGVGTDTTGTLWKYTTDGSLQWERTFDGNGAGLFYGLAAVDGGLATVGIDSQGAVAVKWDLSGQVLWWGSDSGVKSYRAVTMGENGFIAAGSLPDGAVLARFRDIAKEEDPSAWDLASGGAAVFSARDSLHRGEKFTVQVAFRSAVDTSLARITLSYPASLQYVDFSSAYPSVYAVEQAAEGMLTLTGDFAAGASVLQQGDACLLAELHFTIDPNCNMGFYQISLVEDGCMVLDTDRQAHPFRSLTDRPISVIPTVAKEIFVLGPTEIGGPAQYTAAFFPQDAENPAVVWSVSDETVATIDTDGVLRPLRNGTVTVRASHTASGCEAERIVTAAGIQSYLDSLDSQPGRWLQTYEKEDTERTLLVPQGTTVVQMTATMESGSLYYNGITIPSGVEATIPLPSLPATLFLTKRQDGCTETTYTITVQAEAATSFTGIYGSAVVLTALVTKSENASAEGDTVSFSMGDVVLGTAVVTYGTGAGTASLAVRLDKRFSLGENTVEVSVRGGGTLVSSKTLTVIMQRKTITYTVSATTRAYDGTTAVSVALTPLNSEPGDNVSLAATGILASPNAGIYQQVNLQGITLSDADSAYYTAPGTADAVPLTGDVTIVPKRLSTEMIADIPTQTYTGTAVAPVLIVRDGERALQEGQDYTTAYSNNTDPGIAIATVTGVGNYQGSVSAAYTIEKAGSPPVLQITYGDRVTFTAQTEIEGTVQLYLNSLLLASAETVDREAVLTVDTTEKQLSIGSNTLQAVCDSGGTVALSGSNGDSIVLFLEPKQENTPALSVSFANEMLTGFVPQAAYWINGVSVLDGIYPLEEHMGTTLTIVRQPRDAYYTESAAQILTLPARPAAPSVTAISATAPGRQDGIIVGVTAAMEYRAAGETTWRSCMGSVLTGMAAGVYQIRVRATSDSFHSAAANVLVDGPCIKLTAFYTTTGQFQRVVVEQVLLSTVTPPHNTMEKRIFYVTSLEHMQPLGSL